MRFLGITWSLITWRRFLLIQAVGQLAALIMTIDWGELNQPIAHTGQRFFALGVYVTCLVPLALAADEAIGRGARTRHVYLVVMLVNPVLACLVYSFTIWLFHGMFAQPYPPRWMFVGRGVHVAITGTLGLIVFMNSRMTQRMLDGLRGAELRRVQLDRQLVDSRLATAEAQIDPQMLFSALAHIKHGYVESQPQAEQELNELIRRLRAALARIAAANEAEVS